MKAKRPKELAGVDICVEPAGSPSDGANFILNNSGPGKYFPGGPTCNFRGKEVPVFVRWHDGGSITSEILVQMLQTLDLLNLFPHDDPSAKPFLLLDGHVSRLELPF